MSDELTKQEAKQLEITERDGKTTIVFRKAILKGKVTSSEVLNTILIAAKMQAELYIKQLATGTALNIAEVKALKDLSDITKLEPQLLEEPKRDNVVDTTAANKTIYEALTERLSGKN